MSQNHEAASAASSKKLQNGVGVVDAEEVQASPDRLEAEQQPRIDGSNLGEVADPDNDGGDDESMDVDVNDLRKNVECPICLGIIKICRTMTECLHRFCKDCIEKAMRVGRNECPACRIHCPSRRSFKGDPNFDAIISLFFPNIEKFEAEEMPFLDEERLRNEQVKAAIDKTAKRQSEAMPRRRPSKMMKEGSSSSSRSTRKRRKIDANDAEQSHVAPEIAAEAENHVLAVDKSPVREGVDEEGALKTSGGRKTLTEFGPNCNHW